MADIEIELSERNWKRLRKIARKQHQSVNTCITRAIEADLKRAKKYQDRGG